MMLRIIGEHPLAKDQSGNLKSRIATVFPFTATIVTLPGIHATQRVAYVEAANQQRAAKDLPPLTEAEQGAEWMNSVDLIMEDDCILIRPDPDNMELAFTADDMLQEMISKQKIKFLHVLNEKVRNAIKKRGEYWRIATLPRSPDEMKQMIAASRIRIGGREIYYYNKTAGTRYLTYQEFCRLGVLDDQGLRQHLLEIREYSRRGNRIGSPEIDFFMADKSFSSADFAPCDFDRMSRDELRAVHLALTDRFRAAVSMEFHHDDLNSLAWRNSMFAALIGRHDEVVPEEAMLGLSPEFFMQIEWLPGGRVENGELMLDTVYQEPGNTGPEGDELTRDEKPRGFIFNFIREYGDIEYVNIGRVNASLSRRAPSSGRRGVYIAEIKLRESDREIVQIIRMQKWGVREHLDEGKSLLEAIIESEEYTEYILDRRLGCRQLGMNLPIRVIARRIGERYHGLPRYEGTLIWSPYFERDYIRGIATDKVPSYRFENETFALRFATMLGRAAAANLIVGRVDLRGNVIFDDGDEVVIEDRDGTPRDIVVADPTGTFVDYRSDLVRFAGDYALPVNSRSPCLQDGTRFAEAYVAAFVDRFREIQDEYRKRRRGFDTLFKHRPRNEMGSFAYRWEQVLSRLDRTDVAELAQALRAHIVAIK